MYGGFDFTELFKYFYRVACKLGHSSTCILNQLCSLIPCSEQNNECANQYQPHLAFFFSFVISDRLSTLPLAGAHLKTC